MILDRWYTVDINKEHKYDQIFSCGDYRIDAIQVRFTYDLSYAYLGINNFLQDIFIDKMEDCVK